MCSVKKKKKEETFIELIITFIFIETGRGDDS